MVKRLLLAWLTASLFITSAVAFAALTLWASPSAQAQGTVFAIDVGDVSGNTATTVGTVNTCFQATAGQPYSLDVVVQDVTDVVYSQFTLGFQGEVTLQSVDDSLLNHPTPAAGNAAFSDKTTAVPDTGQHHNVVVSNQAAVGSGGFSGSGILVRFTMTAPSTAGLFDLTLEDTVLLDHTESNAIPHTPSGATLAVDTPCPSTSPGLTDTPGTTETSPGQSTSPATAPGGSLTATAPGGSPTATAPGGSPAASSGLPSPTPSGSSNGGNDGGGGLPLAAWIALGLGAAVIVGGGLVILGLALRRRLAGRP